MLFNVFYLNISSTEKLLEIIFWKKNRYIRYDANLVDLFNKLVFLLDSA